MIAIGEIGPTGEIRKVNHIVYDRVHLKPAFKRVFIQKIDRNPKTIEVVGVSSVKEAIYKTFGKKIRKEHFYGTT